MSHHRPPWICGVFANRNTRNRFIKRNWKQTELEGAFIKCVCDNMLANVDNAPSLQNCCKQCAEPPELRRASRACGQCKQCAEAPERVDSANNAPSLQSVWTDTCPATIFAPNFQSVWTDTWANPQLIRKDTEYLIETDWQLAAPPHGLMGYSAAGNPMASVQMTQI